MRLMIIEIDANALIDEMDRTIGWAVRKHFNLKPDDPLPNPDECSLADRVAIHALIDAAMTEKPTDAVH